jgi:hypothetical protein
MHSSAIEASSVADHPSGSPLPELARAITAGAVLLAAATAAWLRLIAEFDERGGWHGYGIQSCGHWLAWQCGLSPGAAREHVRVARALRGLPLIEAAFAAGRLSYSKVRALTRIAEPDSEASLLEVATELTASQVERTVRQWRRADVPDEHAEQLDGQSFQFWWDDDGMLTVKARLNTEQGAALMTAIESLAERAARHERALAKKVDDGSPDPGADEPEAARARERIAGRRIDALASLADAAADAHRRAGDPPRREVVVHVDAAVLADDAAAGRAYIEGGPALSAAQARRMLCEATVVTAIEKDREPLALGRRKRRGSKAQRNALLRRDGGCARPGCLERRIERLHVHHMRHWLFGGTTDLANLVLLCESCHGLVHDLDLVLSRQGRTLVAATSDGRRVWGAADAAFTGGVADLDADPGAGTGTGTECDAFAGIHPIDQELGRRPRMKFRNNSAEDAPSERAQGRPKRDPSTRPGRARPRSQGRDRRPPRSGRDRVRPVQLFTAIDETLFPAGPPPLPDTMRVNGERMNVRYVVDVLMGNRDLVRRLAAESGAQAAP